MGAKSSKVRTLNPKTIKELQKNVDVDFSKEEIEQWFREYQSSLTEGRDRLTMDEFKKVYNSVFEGNASDFVQHLFRFFDADHDGYVDFKEFVVGLCVSGSDKVEAKLRWAFTMYDMDGNGFITRDEMDNLLKAIYKMLNTGDASSGEGGIPTIEDLVKEFFESADQNKDNKINRDEFVAGVQNMPMILQLLECDPDAGKADDLKFDVLDDAGDSSDKSSAVSGSRSSAYKV